MSALDQQVAEAREALERCAGLTIVGQRLLDALLTTHRRQVLTEVAEWRLRKVFGGGTMTPNSSSGSTTSCSETPRRTYDRPAEVPDESCACYGGAALLSGVCPARPRDLRLAGDRTRWRLREPEEELNE